MTVVERMLVAMETIGAVGKKSRNEQQGFNFRGIDAVVNAASPAFRAAGILVYPALHTHKHEVVEIGKNRSLMSHVIVEVIYTFASVDGDEIVVIVPGEAMDSGDKATSKAMSVAFRTALLQALSLPTDEPDPDATTYERAAAFDLDAAYAEAMDPRATVRSLRGLWKRADAAGLLPETVANAAGEPMPLGDLIAARGKALQDALDHRKLEAEILDTGGKKATRSGRGTPATDDPWLSDPAGDTLDGASTPAGPETGPVPPVSPNQIKAIHAIAKSIRMSDDDRLELIRRVTGRRVRSTTDINIEEASAVIAELKDLQERAATTP